MDRDPYDFYPTPITHVDAAIKHILFGYRENKDYPFSVLDPGAGNGIWGERLRLVCPNANITGVELREENPHKDYNAWFTENFFTFDNKEKYNIIIGNPPFNKPYKNSIEKFIYKGLELLKPNGIMIFLHLTSFLNGQARAKSLFKNSPPRSVWLCSKRPSFTPDGKTGTREYAFSVWLNTPLKKSTKLYWMPPEWFKNKKER